MSTEDKRDQHAASMPPDGADPLHRRRSFLHRPLRLRNVVLFFFVFGFGLGMVPKLIFDSLPWNVCSRYETEYFILCFPGYMLGGGHCANDRLVGPLNGVAYGSVLAGFVWLLASMIRVIRNDDFR